ncbi:hypothetical protein ACFC1L_44660 [Streptomyces sp. NPDC056210]|uniref:hypothetical protein n=1 Tax=Streptomyces TaxID=1883 RepID=UPI0035DA7DE1
MDKHDTTDATPTWESETRKVVDWIFSGDGPMPTRTVGPNGRPRVDTTDETNHQNEQGTA